VGGVHRPPHSPLLSSQVYTGKNYTRWALDPPRTRALRRRGLDRTPGYASDQEERARPGSATRGSEFHTEEPRMRGGAICMEVRAAMPIDSA